MGDLVAVPLPGSPHQREIPRGGPEAPLHEPHQPPSHESEQTDEAHAGKGGQDRRDRRNRH